MLQIQNIYFFALPNHLESLDCPRFLLHNRLGLAGFGEKSYKGLDSHSSKKKEFKVVESSTFLPPAKSEKERNRVVFDNLVVSPKRFKGSYIRSLFSWACCCTGLGCSFLSLASFFAFLWGVCPSCILLIDTTFLNIFCAFIDKRTYISCVV